MERPRHLQQSIRRSGRLIAFASLALAATLAHAQPNERGPGAPLRSVDGSARLDSLDAAVRTPSRGIQRCVDVTGVDSWDSLDDPDNRTIDVNIGSGMVVVGAAWDVGIATNGDSWLSDATVLISDSSGTADVRGIFLSPGFAFEQPGNREFSSGGVIRFAENDLPTPVTNADGIVRLQFFELIDDVSDAVDAAWRNAADPVTCPGIWLEIEPVGGPGPAPDDANAVPVNRTLALLGLALMLGLLGAAGVRRLS